MKKQLITGLLTVFLLGLTSISRAAVFTDTFDDPAFTNSHWQDGTPGTLQTWNFITLNGTDLGYHSTVNDLSTTEPAVKYLDNGGYYNAGLYIESLVRIDSHAAVNTVDKNKVFLGFGATAATGDSYSAGIKIDNIGVPALSLYLSARIQSGPSPAEPTLAQSPISINFDTFYKLTVQVDANETMAVSLYDLNGSLLGNISASKAFDADNGVVAIAGRYATTFNDFYVSGTSVVPVPAAVWLFGSGLIGLIGFARHKTRS